MNSKKTYIHTSESVSYRNPMRVREILAFPSYSSGYSFYPVCPRCGITMERDYQSYCDRCGQALNWDDYDNALVVYYR